MNAYYNDFQNTKTISVPESAPRRGALSSLIERLLCMIDALLAIITSNKVLNVIRVAVTTVCFFTLLGVIGGIERGLISWGWGIVIAVVIAVIEGICIKKCK